MTLQRRPRTFLLFIALGCVLVGIAGAWIFLYSDSIARFAWRKLEWSALALMLVRRDADLAMRLGSYYFNGGAYDLGRAEEAYRKAVAINERQLMAHYELARIYFVRGDGSAALEEVSKEFAVNPSNGRVLYIRGLVRGYAGFFENAEDDFRRFVAWVPTEWAGYNDLAWILAKERKYADMAAVAREGIEKAAGGRENPWLWNMLGIAYLNLGDKRSAEAALLRAEELAAPLTEALWRQSYPGNDPSTSESGVAAFRRAIAENLEKAQ
jgi:Flp pilus assembly protein TadD